MSPRDSKYRMLRSDVANILANSVYDRFGPTVIITVDETEGRITLTSASQRTVYQRFHVFIVEEPVG